MKLENSHNILFHAVNSSNKEFTDKLINSTNEDSNSIGADSPHIKDHHIETLMKNPKNTTAMINLFSKTKNIIKPEHIESIFNSGKIIPLYLKDKIHSHPSYQNYKEWKTKKNLEESEFSSFHDFKEKDNITEFESNIFKFFTTHLK